MVLTLYQYVSIVTAALALAFGIIDIFLAIRKKRNVSLYKIIEKIPIFIDEAESCLGESHGVQKLVYVLSKIQNECVLQGVKYNKNEEAFKSIIEDILSTPQKKEEEK